MNRIDSLNEFDSARKPGNLRPPAAPSAGVCNGAGAPSRPPVNRWLVVGTSVADCHLTAQQIIVGKHLIRFEGPAGWEAVPYVGSKMLPGEKRTASIGLSQLLHRIGARETNGGGDINVARELNQIRCERRLVIGIRVIDTGTPSNNLAAELTGLGVECYPLRLAPTGQNLILTAPGQPNPLILRSPLPPPALLNSQWHNALGGPDSMPKLIVINSPNSEAVARAAVRTAQRYEAVLVSILTPSTSLDTRIRWLLQHSHISVMNLAEFQEVAAALGTQCPVVEHLTSVAGVAKALGEVTQIVSCGDVVVTMGEVGQVVYDAHTGSICRIGLTDPARAICRNFLPPACINGIGDRYVARLAAARMGLTMGSSTFKIVHAAQRAWLDLLASSGRFLRPDPHWFRIWVVSTGNMRWRP